MVRAGWAETHVLKRPAEVVRVNISRWTGRGPGGGGITLTPQLITIAVLIVIVLALGAFAAGRAFNGNDASADEVKLEPTLTAGTHPFTPPVGIDKLNVKPPPKVGGLRSGNMPGLFGGEGKQASCNPASLVSFLQADQKKGAVWAGVLGIKQNEIKDYVSGLTAVVLRSDTAVTNHGFKDGQATTIPAVLQAGTAVLVDGFGKPVVKCYCGNPLTAPLSYSKSRYYGKAWPAFSAENVTVVQNSDVLIKKFILANPQTGEPVPRVPGTAGQPAPPSPADQSRQSAESQSDEAPPFDEAPQLDLPPAPPSEQPSTSEQPPLPPFEQPPPSPEQPLPPEQSPPAQVPPTVQLPPPEHSQPVQSPPVQPTLL